MEHELREYISKRSKKVCCYTFLSFTIPVSGSKDVFCTQDREGTFHMEDLFASFGDTEEGLSIIAQAGFLVA